MEVLQSLSIIVPIVATVISGLFANRARKASNESEELRIREARVASDKAKAYQRLIEVFGAMLTKGAKPSSEKEAQRVLAEAATLFPVFASDEVFEAHLRLQQAAFNGAPAAVFTRLYAELVLAIRRDLGYPKTTISALEVLAVRVTDAYTSMADQLTKPLEQVYADAGWQPPWNQGRGA